MTRGPALALVELSSIARGHRVADAMLKRAPVELWRAEWFSNGKYLVLVEGGVAAVEEAFAAGVAEGGDRIVDRLFLPQAHAALWPLLGGEMRGPAAIDSLGVVETATVAAAVLAGDAALKAAAVRLIELQLGRGIGGKAFFTLTGALGEVEAAVEAALAILDASALVATEIIAAPHADLGAKL